MGEGTPGLKTSRSSKDRPAPREAVEELGGEIAVVRDELDTLLGELDRRRHDALDVPLQLRRHAAGASLTALAVVAAAAGSVWLTLWRRRRRDRLGAQAGRLQRAVSRMTEHPERVATEQTMAGKIATAAANAAVAVLIKKVLERGVERLLEAHPNRESTAAPPSSNGPRFAAVRRP